MVHGSLISDLTSRPFISDRVVAVTWGRSIARVSRSRAGEALFKETSNSLSFIPTRKPITQRRILYRRHQTAVI